MKMISPSGVLLNVPDNRAETLRLRGYRYPEASVKSTEAPVAAPGRKKTVRKPKTEQESFPVLSDPEDS